MGSIFMNSKNSKSCGLHRLIHNVTDKVNSESHEIMLPHQVYYTWKNI